MNFATGFLGSDLLKNDDLLAIYISLIVATAVGLGWKMNAEAPVISGRANPKIDA